MIADPEVIENPTPAPVSEDDEQLLREIRDDYAYFDNAWREPREERNTDMRYICGDPWDEQDRRARKDAGRPCINHDELGQYVNSTINSVRQNKRGIKVTPGGAKSSDATAEFRQNLIRGIEYRCKAPGIYLNAYQAMVEGSYGYFRIGREYVSDDVDSNDPEIFNQRITIKPIANPNSVLYDPDCKEPDWSDAKKVFVLDPVPRAEFKRLYPDAQITDFTTDQIVLAKDWITDKNVLVAEYWKIIFAEQRKYLLENGMVLDKLPRGVKPAKMRVIRKPTVWQFMTNGIEILKRSEQPGKHIPIIPMVGLVRYVDDQAGVTNRKIFSLVRLARDPQMSLAYLVSLEAEEAGLTPKVPYIGYVGQFETDADAWENATKVPRAFLQVDPLIDGVMNNGEVLPIPQRQAFAPNFQQYEIAKDSCRRAVQAAMGITPLPTAAQRDNQKSGVALQKVKEQEEIGSYHFVDGYDRAVSFAGRVIEEYIPVTYDTEREETLRKADDSHEIGRLNTEQPYPDPQTGEMKHYPVDPDSNHDVTVSTGPSQASQQEAASDFLDLLVSNLQTLPVAPPQAAKLLAMAIQMKQLGPKGDEMAEIISPTNPAQAQQAAQQIAQAQQQLQAQGELIAAMKVELDKLHVEKSGRVIDNEYKMAITKMQEENKLAMAEVNTKSQMLSERLEFVNDLAHKFLDQAHDVGLQAQEQAHEKNQTQAATEAAAQQQALQTNTQQPSENKPGAESQ